MAASFPSAIVTSLKEPVNNLSHSLTQDILITDTTVYVENTTGAPASGSFHVGTEIFFYASKTGVSYNVTGGRGANGTTQAAHSMASGGNEVVFGPEAHHVGDLQDEVVAIETALGANMANVVLQTLADAKGDTIVASADNAWARLAIGNANDLYYVNTDTPGWASAATLGLQTTLSAGLLDKTRHIDLTPGGADLPASNPMELVDIAGTYFPYQVLRADPDTDQFAYWKFIVPDSYDGGNISISINYETTATSGDVMWVVKTIGIAEAEAIDTDPSVTYTFSADTVDGTAGDLCVATKGGVDPTWAAGDLAVIELYRDANDAGDTCTADVDIVMVEIEWEVT